MNVSEARARFFCFFFKLNPEKPAKRKPEQEECDQKEAQILYHKFVDSRKNEVNEAD